MAKPKTCLLVLENGDVHRGTAFGLVGESVGELVFNTSLSGYQEVLTDPSYRGQIVLMTYPSIGNYGITAEDSESDACYLAGFIVKEVSPQVSNHRATTDISTWLADQGVVGIAGLDTRAIVRRVRNEGALRCIVSSLDDDPASLLEKVRAWPGTQGRDLVQEVTCAASYSWSEGLEGPFLPALPVPEGDRPRLAVLDFGVKRNMLRGLHAVGFDVTVFPASATGDAVRETAPDCLFLSNGPGDPEPLEHAVATIRDLTAAGLPTFGICLGHQLTALALGGKTVKMKFGHHGSNQPVIDLTTDRTEITSQNHSYVVDRKSLDDGMIEVTHENLNDRTVEGLRHRDLPLFTVQYHPEAAPGPRDAFYLFGRFMDLVRSHGGVAR